MENFARPTFIDLFCGIGGMRLGFESAGGRCVFSSDWDKFAQQTYAANFGETPHGDIRQIPSSEIPDHDILVGGFPCQPFSISGVSKKNSLGRAHGFEDRTQGTLFFGNCRSHSRRTMIKCFQFSRGQARFKTRAIEEFNRGGSR
jgi:DNA (cytosine-5)-methyltransferase 1